MNIKNTINKTSRIPITGMKIISLILVLFIITTFSSCNAKQYSEEEIYGARAAYTISRHIGDAVSFVISYIEYREEDESEKIIVDCTLYYSNNEFKRYVFILGTGKFFDDRKENGVYDEETEFYMLNYGDIFINKDDTKKINEKSVYNLFEEFLKSGEKELLGMS